jgi:2'-5' RNA ligase
VTLVDGSHLVRVMVLDAWDHVTLQARPDTTVAEVKRLALGRALRRAPDPAAYGVKFRGAQVFDEGTTLAALGAGPNAELIVLPARRRPVK